MPWVWLLQTQTNDVWIEDASIAAIIMQVTAHSLGLAHVGIYTGSMHNDEMMARLRKSLKIPEQYSILCILAIIIRMKQRNLTN